MLGKELNTSHTAISALTSDHVNVPLLEQNRKKIAEYKGESSQLCREMLVMGLPDEDYLFLLHSELEDKLFQCSHLIRKCLAECEDYSYHEF